MDHLRTGTNAENMADRRTRGRNLSGHDRLNREIAEEIRALRKSGMLISCIARKFGVAEQTVGDVCSMKTWV